MTARRPPKRTCSPALPSDHVVAVGLRCGKANTNTPIYFARLDPVFPRDSSGRSIIFPIKKESTRLATSSPFPKISNGKGPSRGEINHPSPAYYDACRACRPCSVFTHANPRASGSVATSGGGRRIDTARRASGDATASSPIFLALFQ